MMNESALREFLEPLVDQFNSPNFIADDPISVPHDFKKPQDIEIAGLIAAIFSWGNRTTIIKKSKEFLSLMDNDPQAFVLNHSEQDLKPFTRFVHRTFQPTDGLYFLDFLNRYYSVSNTLEDLFISADSSIESGLIHFHSEFFKAEHAPNRTRKHIPTPVRKSTCKRLNMFLRWMVRQDNCGVDFGIWKRIRSADLICPIDVHVSNTSRTLGLLNRQQNDWKAALELTKNLARLDPDDPVKYDFALFGIGVNGLHHVLDRF